MEKEEAAERAREKELNRLMEEIRNSRGTVSNKLYVFNNPDLKNEHLKKVKFKNEEKLQENYKQNYFLTKKWDILRNIKEDMMDSKIEKKQELKSIKRVISMIKL